MMHKVQQKSGVFLFTVAHLHGYEVEEYYGLVVGKAMFGANFVKDWLARAADTFGGHVRGYESSMGSAMESAALEMANQAAAQGANAVIGVDVHAGSAGRMLLATCSGTAVRIRPLEK